MIHATAAPIKIADAKTRIIPGNGPLQRKDDLQAEHDMLIAAKDRVPAMIRQGKSLAEVAAGLSTKEFDAKWGPPAQFVSMTYTRLVRHTHLDRGIL
jgi:cyclase